MDYPVDDLKLVVLNIGYAVHDKDWNWRDVSSPFTRLYYVTDGYAQIEMENKIYDLVSGMMYMVPSFVKHTNICNGHFEHYYIHVFEDGLSSNHLFEEYAFPFETIPEKGDLELFMRLCELNPLGRLPQSNPKSYDNQPTLIQNLRINKMRSLQDIVESRGILYILVSRFLDKATPKTLTDDDRVKNAINYIRKNLGSRILVEDLAKKSALSTEHFIRVFKNETGETPNTYISKAKMERAMVMLATGDAAVKSIALSLGYDDVPYFNRAFKKFLGMTPQQYRESNPLVTTPAPASHPAI